MALLVSTGACFGGYKNVRLVDEWPAKIRNYEDVVWDWTRKDRLRADYQEVCELVATPKSAEWRAAHAVHDAEIRGLQGDAREQYMQQARADIAGPYEFEVMVTTWDRRENDLDRGTKSVWRVVLIDEQGKEIEPIEIVKDRRPTFIVRAEFPGLGEFATPYIARFPRTTPIYGAGVKQVRLRMSSPRGGVEVTWDALK